MLTMPDPFEFEILNLKFWTIHSTLSNPISAVADRSIRDLQEIFPRHLKFISTSNQKVNINMK